MVKVSEKEKAVRIIAPEDPIIHKTVIHNRGGPRVKDKSGRRASLCKGDYQVNTSYNWPAVNCYECLKIRIANSIKQIVINRKLAIFHEKELVLARAKIEEYGYEKQHKDIQNTVSQTSQVAQGDQASKDGPSLSIETHQESRKDQPSDV